MTFEEFIVKILPHYRYMYRIAASVMRSDFEAADVVQDTMLRLYEMRNQLDNIADIRFYCASVMRNACLNIIRGRREHTSIEEISDIDSSQDIHTALEWKDMSVNIEKTMNCLPEYQRKVLKMSAFGGFSNAEIADMLGITQGNVRVLLSRARNKIKELFSN